MWSTTKSLSAVMAAGALLVAGAGAAQAEIKCDTIRMIVPWKAGGGTDRIGRGLAVALEKQSGKSVIVDNIGGASSATGSIKAMKAKPNGCTILMNGSTEIIAFMTFKRNLPFKLSQMKFVGAFFNTPTWMLSHKKRRYASFRDFLAKAKANPGKLTIGTGGAAGAHMIMAAAIKGLAGIEVRIVPYSGGADLKKAILANQIDAGVIHSPVLLKEVRAGLVEVLATGAPLDKIEFAPVRKTPTLTSMNMPISIAAVRGVFVPKATPDAVVGQLTKWLEGATRDPDFIAFGKKFGFPPVWIPGAQFERDMRRDIAAFREIYDKYIKAK